MLPYDDGVSTSRTGLPWLIMDYAFWGDDGMHDA